MTALETSDSAVEFLIRFVRVGHEAGYPTADLEDGVLALARSLGLPDVHCLMVSAVILPGRFQPAGSRQESLVRSG